MNNESTPQRLGIGAAAGLAGTFLIQGLLGTAHLAADQTGSGRVYGKTNRGTATGKGAGKNS